MRHEKIIMKNQAVLAIDFDGTLCEHAFPSIGAPNKPLIDKLIKMRADGNKLILWTCRRGEQLHAAVKWCSAFGLEFDAINENVENEFSALGRSESTAVSPKAYAHIYLDDKAMHPDTFIELIDAAMKKNDKTMRDLS